MDDLFAEGTVIFSYTRQQALEDGVLVDLSGLFPSLCEGLYRYHVACTTRVWALIEKGAMATNGSGFDGIVWDILWMSVKYPVEIESEASRLFEVIIKGGGHCSAQIGNPANETYRLRVMVGPGDNAEPVITIMFPDED